MRILLTALPFAFIFDQCGGSEPDEPETCEEAQTAIEAELADIQACNDASDCGEVLENTSCGCTRNLVARMDADTTEFYDLLELQGELGCDGMISTCDCPDVDGFACLEGQCTWNYTGWDSTGE